MTANDLNPDNDPRLTDLYRGFAEAGLVPLWTEIGDLMPSQPRSAAQPHLWRWSTLYPLAEAAGTLVPVGRGGERRAIALANPGLGGRPFATPTLWAAIQYLGGRESAPTHRHSQHAFRFVVEGEGVWTVVNGDPVSMRRGDFLPQPGWNWHAHHNATDEPMAWIDGLDIPLAHYLDATGFEFGEETLAERSTPEFSASERLWAHPGLVPIGAPAPEVGTPLLAYRWEQTDHALNAQLELERDGLPGVVSPGHAAVRYVNPTDGSDVMPTIRAEFHRLAGQAARWSGQETSSSVLQVFDGSAVVQVGEKSWEVSRGDLLVIPSWTRYELRASTASADFFRFSDAPVLAALSLHRHADLRNNA